MMKSLIVARKFVRNIELWSISVVYWCINVAFWEAAMSLLNSLFNISNSSALMYFWLVIVQHILPLIGFYCNLAPR